MEEGNNEIKKRPTPYADSYRQRYEAHMWKKREERQKQQDKQQPESILQKAEEALVQGEKAIIQEVKEIENKVVREIEINPKWIIAGVIILVAVLGIILFFYINPTVKLKYSPLDVVVSNSTGMPGNVYYNQKFLINLYGWESLLVYNNKSDRLFGSESYKKIVFDDKGKAYTVISLDNQIRLEPLTTNPNQATRIGWFTNTSNIKTTEEDIGSEKQLIAEMIDDNGLSSANLTYDLYKNKPYFKVQFSADAENLGNFAYGLVIKGYDIYLQNGTVLKNDNQIVNLNKTTDVVLYNGKNVSIVNFSSLLSSLPSNIDINKQAISRGGSAYKINNSKYEMFYNSNSSQAIIVYSPETLYFDSSFYWNVFRVYVPYNQGYSPLYVTVIDNANLTYDSNFGDWSIQNKDIDEYAGFYMNQIAQEIG